MEVCNARVNGLTSEIVLVRTELTSKIGDLRVEIAERLAELRVELLRWSFVFWIGQVAALFAAMAMFAEWITP